MAAINTLDGSVFMRFCSYRLATDLLSACYQLATSWLLAGHDSKSIHFKTDIYDVPKWHMATINTLDCSVFTGFFGYQLAIGWLFMFR